MERTITVSKGPSDKSYGISLGLAKNQAHNARVPVAQVVPNGPADRAGISAGDLVTAINGTSPARLTEALLRSVLESGQSSICFTLLPGSRQSTGSTVAAGAPLTMSRSCYDVASSSDLAAAANNSSGSGASHTTRRRGSNVPSLTVDSYYADDADFSGSQSIGNEEDVGGEILPRITKKGRRYTPDRLAVASATPKIVFKRGYSPVLTNTSSPDLLSSAAAKMSGSSRSLQPRSPISSPMYIREFDEDPIVDVLAAGPPVQQSSSGRSAGSASGIYATQPRRSTSKSLTPHGAGAPICKPIDIDDDVADDHAVEDNNGLMAPDDAVVAVSPGLSDSKPVKPTRSNSQEVAAVVRQNFQRQHHRPRHQQQHQQQQHSVASTPRVQKLKNVLGESSQSVTVVSQDGLFISEKLSTNFLYTPPTVSRLLQKSTNKFAKFTFATVSSADCADDNSDGVSQTPVVKNALLKAGELRQYQQHQRQQAFIGSVTTAGTVTGDRRAQSFEALLDASRQGAASPPQPFIVENQRGQQQQQDINAVFSVTIERCPEGKLTASQLPCTFDANLRVDSDSCLTILPTESKDAYTNSPHQWPQQEQKLPQFTIAVGRDCGTSYKRKKLRLVTPDWQVVFRHDDDDRCLKALQEKLHNFLKLRQLPYQQHHHHQQQQQQQFMLLHPPAAAAGNLDDPSGNSPRQTGLKILKNFGDRLWRVKDTAKHQQSQPLHLLYNPPQQQQPDPSLMSQSAGSYGLPLHQCPMGTVDGVPLIVQLCCQVIECGAIRREGVYRISGNSKNIDALESELSKPVDQWNPGCELWLEYNVVASVLKRFLLQLPDPLIPAIYYNDFLTTQKLTDHRNRMLKLHRLLGVMEDHADHPQHRCHRLTLQYLVNHLGRVSEQSVYNRMQLYNLAMVFAPSLFGQRAQETMLMHSSNLIKLTKSIIQFREWLFADWETADQCVPQLPDEEDEASSSSNNHPVESTPPPTQQAPTDPEADRRRVMEIVQELMTEAKLAREAVKAAEGSAALSKTVAAPQYQERDIDAEIDRRLAEPAGTSETTDETTDATDGERDLTDSAALEALSEQQQKQQNRLLQDVERLSQTVEQLSEKSRNSLERLRHERELVADRLRKAEADLLSDSGKQRRLPSHCRSTDSLPSSSGDGQLSDPRPSSPTDDLIDNNDDNDKCGGRGRRKAASADQLASSADQPV